MRNKQIKKQVTKEEFDKFIKSHSNELKESIVGISMPPMKIFYNLKKHKKPIDCVVAYIDLYECHKFYNYKPNEYFIYE